MQTYEALTLIFSQLNTIIPYLTNLKSSLKPEFESLGINTLYVGVNIAKTAEIGDIAYTIEVRPDKFPLTEPEFEEVVKQVAPSYGGSMIIKYDVTERYPEDTILNIELLEDLSKALKLLAINPP